MATLYLVAAAGRRESFGPDSLRTSTGADLARAKFYFTAGRRHTWSALVDSGADTGLTSEPPTRSLYCLPPAVRRPA